ncbi:chlorophyll synthesis pathway protein BchC [Jannaschia aquimarina]|uniref:YjjN protein n=1 Tax=Jannaschia aquimarina TaxID=935700 RepID=A0A0D1D4B8_9RHOB|nr:chlorophyll synthesis pathway protein BchC [Jannaschia aquimarina]KIT14908.1 putative L-galactonate oxidoreductase [Jannaschia aquimarina]SNS59034.1 3-hydroxyethyl bacteriochlorophyllide a dehydrogenase [Jannaschia aquimarina]
MQTTAITLSGPRDIAPKVLTLTAPTAGDVVVAIRHSAISTGTERLLWSGEMPPFPGMGYPLVPGYEAVGEVVEDGGGLKVGETVFVPGSDGFEGARGLFGAAASHVVTSADRVARIDAGHGANGALLALAATARHAIAGIHTALPDLIVGHGTFGRLLARLTVAAGGAPTVWEVDPARRDGADGYTVIDPAGDEAKYAAIYDASGADGILNTVIPRLAKGGEIVLAGFYAKPLSFAYPPAFMAEARLRVSAEWTRDDLIATRDLVEAGILSLDGLVTHRADAGDATAAYATAFDDPACLKMILDWETIQ